MMVYVMPVGAADVFTDLKRAATAVIKTAGKETSQTVGHKYGPDAEKVTDNSLAAAGNTTSVIAVCSMLQGKAGVGARARARARAIGLGLGPPNL